MRRPGLLLLLATVGVGVLPACNDSPTGNQDPDPDGDNQLDLAVCSPANPGFTVVSTNRFFPMNVGMQWIYEGEEDGAELRLEITVLDEIEVVGGVQTRVIQEFEVEDGEVIEISRNFYVQAADGTICYFGEDVDIFEDGEIVSHDGAWRGDEPGNRPGIFMPANPVLGVKYQNEDAPGIAVDEAEIIAVGEAVEVPAGMFVDTIRIEEFNPLDGDSGEKVFAAGVGLIVDGPVELIEF